MDKNEDIKKDFEKLLRNFGELNQFSKHSNEAMGYIRGVMFCGKLCLANKQVALAKMCFDEGEKVLVKVNAGVKDKLDELRRE